ncbi:high affinity Mn2+ porin [Opitutus sp. GAS368]|nr:high affinity Mn2+ porin [Opitutus sp. GAS368]
MVMKKYRLLPIFFCLAFLRLTPAARAEPAAPATSDWSLHTQVTSVEQWHYSFPSAYEGVNSLTHAYEAERTFSFSLYLDRKLWPGAELVYNPEIFQGHGLSQTFGAGGFPNGEAVKSGFPNLHYNTSRLFLRQVFGLGGEKEAVEDDLNQIAGKIDVNRITVSVGKFSANDFFDDNRYSHDPRTQFMNWALWESAAWDYPADVVGFTAGAVVEWNTANTTLRYGLLMEPAVANGDQLDPHIGRAYGQILQFDYRYEWNGRHGTVRPFVYWNQAHMGLYRAAAAQQYPEDIVPTRAYRSKEGAGISWDQELSDDVGAFARLSWNDGRTESFAFAEIDRSLAAGLSAKGRRWSRPDDVLGAAVFVNGLTSDHRHYLAQGGTGLLLGDGGLSYAAEEGVELYYAFQYRKWLQISPDYQWIKNPGYNSARGPVSIFAVRAHLQL